MPDPNDLLTIIKDRLTGDATLMGILEGGVYTKPLEPKITPDAFYGRLNLGQVKPSAVLRQDPITPGAGRASYIDHAVVAVWLYSVATDSGKAAFASATARLRALLQDWSFTAPNGFEGVWTFIGQAGYRDDPVLLGAIVDTIRFRATLLNRLP